jgi:hypothetical protein
VRLDTVQYGSDTDPDIAALVARGLAGNILEREPSGAIVFHSGKQEYRTVVISRPDGFPTEHTRQMAQMVSVFPLCRDLDRYYTFMGMEWKPAWVLYENILRGWGDNRYHDIVVPVCHGMVMVEGSKMKSSKGAVVLADEFLDEVETTREVRALAERSGDRVAAAGVADIVVKSFFLSRKMTKDLNFSWDQVVNPADNPGWEIATAWCAMHDPRDADRPAAGRLDATRTAFFKSFDLDRALNHAASEIDLAGGIKFLHRLARSFHDSDGDRRSSELARRIMRRGLAAFGM